MTSSITNHTWGAGTLRESSLITSRALMITYGSNVLRVVLTVMLPSTRFNSQPMPSSFRARVTAGHTSRKYFSAPSNVQSHNVLCRYCKHQHNMRFFSPRYLGKSVANELSSKRPLGFSSLEKGFTSQWLIPSWSHGFSFRCCDRQRPTRSPPLPHTSFSTPFTKYLALYTRTPLIERNLCLGILRHSVFRHLEATDGPTYPETHSK